MSEMQRKRGFAKRVAKTFVAQDVATAISHSMLTRQDTYMDGNTIINLDEIDYYLDKL